MHDVGGLDEALAQHGHFLLRKMAQVHVVMLWVLLFGLANVRPAFWTFFDRLSTASVRQCFSFSPIDLERGREDVFRLAECTCAYKVSASVLLELALDALT